MHTIERLKLVIFDFDGVIADTFDRYYELNKKAMAHIGIELSEQAYRDMFNTNIHASFAAQIGDQEKLRQFIAYKQTIKSHIYQGADIFSGMAGVIAGLSKKYKLAIASATAEHHVKDLLGQHGLLGYFNPIVGNSSQTKKLGYQHILECHGVEPKESLMVSDTVGDLYEARELGILTAAVGWGFQDESNLKISNPDFYWSVPAEISGQLFNKN